MVTVQIDIYILSHQSDKYKMANKKKGGTKKSNGGGSTSKEPGTSGTMNPGGLLVTTTSN